MMLTQFKSSAGSQNSGIPYPASLPAGIDFWKIIALACTQL